MSNNHETSKLDNKLKLGIILNTCFTFLEFAAGLLSGSLALISDAGHNLTDVTSLVVTFIARKIARKEANLKLTYGYGRATILAALINGLILFLLAFYIFYEAYQRFLNPEPVNGAVIMGVALIGFIMNLSIAYIFKNDKADLNIRSAYLNMLFDALASLGAVIAGLLILLTGQSYFDSLISALIGLLLVKSSFSLAKDALHILLEGVPEGINMQKVEKSILEVSHLIKKVDDLHIWALSSQDSALSCHIIIEDCDLEKSIELVNQVKKNLHEKFKIEHATIETELVECYVEN